jgi:hypothetical protein
MNKKDPPKPPNDTGNAVALRRILELAENTIHSVEILIDEAYRQATPVLKRPTLNSMARTRLVGAKQAIAFYHERTGRGPDSFLAWPDRDPLLADLLGDVLGCGRECLCPACRQALSQALDLVELGTVTEERP